MKTKGRNYMNGQEFKARQSCFDFLCAQAMEILTEFRNACLAGWRALFRPLASEAPASYQLNINFDAPLNQGERP